MAPEPWPTRHARARATKDRADQSEASSPGCKRKCAAVLNPPGSISSRGEDPRQTAQDAGDVEVDDWLAEMSVVQLAVRQCPQVDGVGLREDDQANGLKNKKQTCWLRVWLHVLMRLHLL